MDYKLASEAEITKAYRKLSLRWHPDRNLDNVEEAQVGVWVCAGVGGMGGRVEGGPDVRCEVCEYET